MIVPLAVASWFGLLGASNASAQSAGGPGESSVLVLAPFEQRINQYTALDIQFSGEAAESQVATLFLPYESDREPVAAVESTISLVEFFQPGVEDQVIPRPTFLEPEDAALSPQEEMEQLKQRVGQLETTVQAHEDATRSIIRQSFAERGANITEDVVFGGTLETLIFWADDFDGVAESDIILDTAELDFEILVNPWTLGSLVFEYFDGGNFAFPTTEEDEVFVDRVNIRQAWITVGDIANFPPYMTIGRDVIPFGISTGDPVADVPTIVDPLTVEVFETTEDFVLFGFAYPTCCPPPPPTNPRPAPPVRPLIINPLVRKATTCLFSYCPCTPPTKPLPPTWPPITCPSPYSGAIYFYNGDTLEGDEDHIEHMGGTLGYFRKGDFPYFCVPWSIDMDVDVNSSVFDSDFLQFEYRAFLPQIGYVPGMAAHVKSTLGPVSLVAEWNGALDNAEFVDDVGTNVSIRPAAWQVTLVYQFDWNPSVEFIGAQGTYFVIGYSESSDLAGVTRAIGGDPAAVPPVPPTLLRVGNVPEKRLSVGMGEWVLPGLRVALEYSHIVDYSVAEGGTGNSADGVFMQMTYEW